MLFQMKKIQIQKQTGLGVTLLSSEDAFDLSISTDQRRGTFHPAQSLRPVTKRPPSRRSFGGGLPGVLGFVGMINARHSIAGLLFAGDNFN
jgi:hypothetical protein